MSKTEEVQGEDRTEPTTPDPDDPRKPEDPGDLTKRSWFYVLRKTFHEFSEDQCTDLAAALTYYAVLAVFPAALALVSLLGVIGQGQNAVDKVIETLKPLVSDKMLTDTIQPALDQIAKSDSAGIALVIGIVAALWSASGYVGAFGRAMNRIYEIDEGRPFWKLRPIMLLLTVVAVLLAAVALLMLIVSGPVAESIGNVIGLGDTALTVWGDREVAGPRRDRHPRRRPALLHDAERPAAEVPLDLGRRGGGDPDLGTGLGRLRVLRRQLLQLQQDLRIAGGRHRRAAVPVDHQPRPALRR